MSRSARLWLGLFALAVASEASAQTTAVPPEPASEPPGNAPGYLTPATQPRRASLLDIEAAVGFTFNLTSASGEQPRLGAGAVFWPRAGRWGFGISAHAGPGARVSEPRFIGRLLDAGLVAACHVRTTPERALRWSAAAGPGLRFSMLDGDLPSEARSASVTWVAPSFELELRGDWLLSSELFVGLRASSSLLLLTERYVVREQAVVELARVSFGAGLAFGMMLPAQ